MAEPAAEEHLPWGASADRAPASSLAQYRRGWAGRPDHRARAVHRAARPGPGRDQPDRPGPAAPAVETKTSPNRAGRLGVDMMFRTPLRTVRSQLRNFALA